MKDLYNNIMYVAYKVILYCYYFLLDEKKYT